MVEPVTRRLGVVKSPAEVMFVAVRLLKVPVVEKKLVVVAAVPVAFPKRRVPVFAFVEKRFVLDAVDAKKLVEVAFVEVEFPAVKFWRVDEPVTRMLLAVSEPVRVRFAPFPVVKAKLVAKKLVEVAFVVVLFPVIVTSDGKT